MQSLSNEQATEAAVFNTRVLKKLQNALISNPEVDLLSQFPSGYSTRLVKKRKVVRESDGDITSIQSVLPKQDDDVRSLLCADSIEIIDRLSSSVQGLIKRGTIPRDVSATTELEPESCMALIRLIQEGEIISKGPMPSRRITVKCGDGIVAKLVWGAEDFTEYTTLQYLQEHKASVPAPRPHSLLRLGYVTVFFTSYLPGVTLEAAWTDLDTSQKAFVRDQLDTIFRDLRTMKLPDDTPLGGVSGEGCKDQRRHLRRSTVSVRHVRDFETFQYSNPNYGSMIFIEFLRAFTCQNSHRVVFTHGDLRPENVIVDFSKDNLCIVVGLVDWEDSGFYPEYHEATKITNCLATNEDSDWFHFLPSCVSPHTYPVNWLQDYIWGRHLE